MVAFDPKCAVVEWFKLKRNDVLRISNQDKSLSKSAMVELPIPLYRVSGDHRLVYL